MKWLKPAAISVLLSIFTTLTAWLGHTLWLAITSLAMESVKVFPEELHPNDLMQQGLTQFQQEQFELAIASWQQAYPLYKQPHSKSVTLFYIGLAFNRLGNYSTALQNLEQSLTIIQAIADPDTDTESTILSTLAETYKEIGNYLEAIDLYKDSLEIARSLGNVSEEARILNNLGLAYFCAEKTDQAIEYYQQSLEIAEALVANNAADKQTKATMGYAHHNLGIALAMQAMDSGNFTAAIEHHTQSLAVAQTLGDQRLTGAVHRSLGFVYDELNDFSNAIDAHSQSISSFQSINEPRELSRSYNNRAHAYLEWAKADRVAGHESLALAKLQHAQDDLNTAVTTLDILREILKTDNQRVSIFDTQVMTYNLLQQVLIAQGHIEKALKASEEGRSQALAILLKDKQRQSTSVFNLEQIKQFAKEQNATLVEYTIVPEDNAVHQGKARGKASEIYIWVVQPTGDVVFRRVDLESPEIDLAKTVKLSLKTIGTRNRASVFITEAREEDHTKQLKTLHQILIAPITDFLPKEPNETVIFIPQAELFQIPFPALLDTDNVHLIEKHTILTAPSIQALSLSSQLDQVRDKREFSEFAQEDWLIIGNPTMPEVWNSQKSQKIPLQSLPGAEWEANEIATQFGIVPLIGAEATESSIRQRIESSRVIHLATHGLLEYGTPKDSGISDVPGAIALAPDDTHDGLLTAAELLEFNLNADLVVLSACDTGLGDITGDGVIGLSRSLIQAGASSVVVSLWSVPDAPTAELMAEFYWQLHQGENKAQALRQAMLQTLASHPEPRNWAAFTLIGSAQ